MIFNIKDRYLDSFPRKNDTKTENIFKDKQSSFLLKCWFLSKLKQQGLPEALSKGFLFKCLSVYEQFIVSVVNLIVLS